MTDRAWFVAWFLGGMAFGFRLIVTAAVAMLVLARHAPSQDLVQVVEPQARITKRVILLVDVSGSMRGPELDRAIAAALDVARKGGDQMEVACYAFASGAVRWPAPHQEDSRAPAGWAEMPDEKALAHLFAWLPGCGLYDGTTELGGALRAALAEARDDLSIVVISDGLLGDAAKCLEVLKDGQAARAKLALAPAVVACWTIGAEAQALNDLGREGKGGTWREAAPPSPPPVFGPQIAPQGSVR